MRPVAQPPYLVGAERVEADHSDDGQENEPQRDAEEPSPGVPGVFGLSGAGTGQEEAFGWLGPSIAKLVPLREERLG